MNDWTEPRPLLLPARPPWVPDRVYRTAARLHARFVESGAPEEHFATLARVLTDKRMQQVWRELLRVHGGRGRGGSFLHPATESIVNSKRQYADLAAVAEREGDKEGAAMWRQWSAQSGDLSAVEQQEEAMARLFHLAVLIATNNCQVVTEREFQDRLANLRSAADLMRKAAQQLRAGNWNLRQMQPRAWRPEPSDS